MKFLKNRGVYLTPQFIAMFAFFALTGIAFGQTPTKEKQTTTPLEKSVLDSPSFFFSVGGVIGKQYFPSDLFNEYYEFIVAASGAEEACKHLIKHSPIKAGMYAYEVNSNSSAHSQQIKEFYFDNEGGVLCFRLEKKSNFDEFPLLIVTREATCEVKTFQVKDAAPGKDGEDFLGEVKAHLKMNPSDFPRFHEGNDVNDRVDKNNALKKLKIKGISKRENFALILLEFNMEAFGNIPLAALKFRGGKSHFFPNLTVKESFEFDGGSYFFGEFTLVGTGIGDYYVFRIIGPNVEEVFCDGSYSR